MSSNNIYTPTPCQCLASRSWGYEPPSSDEIAEGSSQTNLGWPQYGEDNGMYGKKLTDEHKKAISVANSISKPWISENMKRLHAEGKVYQWTTEDNPRSQPCIINEIRYNTVTEASIALDIHRTTLSHRCKSPNKKFTEYYYI